MKTTIKVIRARNKKYNNQVLILENCRLIYDTIFFNSLKFNNKIYEGRLNIENNNMTMHCGRQSTIQFDEIEIIK